MPPYTHAIFLDAWDDEQLLRRSNDIGQWAREVIGEQHKAWHLLVSPNCLTFLSTNVAAQTMFVMRWRGEGALA